MQATDLTLECLVHDLNNVFQTLVDAGDLLVKDPRHAALGATILRSVEQARRILDGMRTHASVRPFQEILENAIQFINDLLGPGRVRFDCQVAPEVALRGTWDWERVLINLFLNAAQASPEGATVLVQARKLNTDVEITVEDDGPGIAPELLPEIFQRRVSTKQAKGGLGLHIVDTIVRQNEGVVIAGNRGDTRGASFRIVVPAHIPTGQAQA